MSTDDVYTELRPALEQTYLRGMVHAYGLEGLEPDLEVPEDMLTMAKPYAKKRTRKSEKAKKRIRNNIII